MKAEKIMLSTILPIILISSIALAAEVRMEELDAQLFCENCGADTLCKDKVMAGEIKYHCDKACTIKMKDKEGKELWFMRLNSACVSFSKSGYPKEVRALKDSAEPQNINGYLLKQYNNDYVWFDYSSQNRIIDTKTGTITEASLKASPVNINSLKINTYGSQGRDGKISALEVCGQKFYPRSQPETSKFSINRPLKNDGKSYACDITSYQMSNQNEPKKSKEGKPQYNTYYQKCGDIPYNAYDSGLDSLSCEPKIEYPAAGQELRKQESKLYCQDGNTACRKSSFTFDVYGGNSGYPLGVQIRGGQYAEKTNFKSVTSQKDFKSSNPMKILEADNFAIGLQSFWVKPKNGEKPEVRFVEEPLPTMYVPNGVDVEMHTTYGSFLTYKYLPEFSKPANRKFEGYLLKFDPQRQYPMMVYPVNFNLGQWDVRNMEEAKLVAGSSYHAGLKSRQRFEGGVINVKGSDGKGYAVYKNIVVEWRVNPDLIDVSKNTVSVKQCTEKDCVAAVSAAKQCGNQNTLAIRNYAHISEYVMERLNYIKGYSQLSPNEKKNVDRLMTELIKANEVTVLERYDPNDASKDDLRYVAEVKVKNKGKEEARVWSNIVPVAIPKATSSPAPAVQAPKAMQNAGPSKRATARPSGKRNRNSAAQLTGQAVSVAKEAKASGINQGDTFSAPGELLYPSCRGKVNVGATKAKALAKPAATKKKASALPRFKLSACVAPKFIDSNGNCEIFVCDNNDDCAKQFGKGSICNEESWCDTSRSAIGKAGAPSLEMPAGWAALTSAEITRFQAGCNGDRYKSAEGEFNPTSTYCRTFIKGEGQYQLRCVNSVPAYKFISKCKCDQNDKCMTTTSASISQTEDSKYIVSKNKCDSGYDCSYIIGSRNELDCIDGYCVQIKCKTNVQCPPKAGPGFTAYCAEEGICKIRRYAVPIYGVTYALGRIEQGVRWGFSKLWSSE